MKQRTFRRTNYSGYLVTNQSELLQGLAKHGIVPAYPQVVAEHVTFKYPDKASAPAAGSVVVVGYVKGEGVEALVVEVDGVQERPHGGTFHLTLSLAAGHKPFESNAAIEAAQAAGTVRQLDPIALETEAF